MMKAKLCFFAAVATLLYCSQSAYAQGQMQNGLPPTNLDSFVYEAAGNADAIYGDEGTDGPPPDYMGFLPNMHIAQGFTANTTTYTGLTTGHGSYMPSAWGADEFLNVPEEFYQSSPITITPQVAVNTTPAPVIIPPTVGGGNPTVTVTNPYSNPGGTNPNGTNPNGTTYPGQQSREQSALNQEQFFTNPNNSFVQNHPRRSEVLAGVSAINYTINTDEGHLGGNFSSLEAQDQAIAQQEQQDAAQNGGYITLQQQAQLNSELNNLNTQIQQDNSGF